MVYHGAAWYNANKNNGARPLRNIRRYFLMKIIRAKDYYDMSRKAANIISAQVIMKPNCVLGLATGGTPVGTYKQLVEWYNKGDIDFSEVTRSVESPFSFICKSPKTPRTPSMSASPNAS